MWDILLRDQTLAGQLRHVVWGDLHSAAGCVTLLSNGAKLQSFPVQGVVQNSDQHEADYNCGRCEAFGEDDNEMPRRCR